MVASVRLIQVQDGISTLGLYGAAFCVLCVPGRILGKTYSEQFWRSGVDTGWETNGNQGYQFE